MLNRIARGGSCAAAVVVLSFILVSTKPVSAGPTEFWTRLGVNPHPSARVNAPMVYDSAGKNLVLFGGYDGSTYLNDTWIFNGKTWTQLNPPVSPPPRSASAMAFDFKTKQVVMFGGFNGSQYMGDTWLWDGAAQTWTQANPATNPTAVTLPMLFSDPLNGHVEMVGGYDGFLYQDTTWKWTGSDWKKLFPKNGIWARGAAVVANDFAHRKVVIFGGLADVNPVNTWTWNGVTWTEESPSSQPPWSFYTPAAYDPRIGQVVMFSGSSGLNDTWAWTGSDWLTLSPTHSPIARDSQSLAYDYSTHQMIMFGGEDSNGFLDSTWEWVAIQ